MAHHWTDLISNMTARFPGIDAGELLTLAAANGDVIGYLAGTNDLTRREAEEMLDVCVVPRGDSSVDRRAA